MSKAKEYIDNQCLPKMNPATLTKNNLWDAEESCRWIMDAGDLWYNEQVRLGHSVDDWSDEVMPVQVIPEIETKKPKEEEKPKSVQLTLSL